MKESLKADLFWYKCAMSSENVNAANFERVKTVFVDTFELSENDLSIELEFGDLPQWDSMGHMDLMMGLESEFGVEISAQSISELTSIKAILAHIEG